ncbi:MAG: hypothetical protein RL318_1966, partial [Fibrobacterota bacterium]
MLVGLLALRLLFSAWRDLTGEHLALRSRTDFHHHAWNALQPPFQEQLQALEAGTRAALQLRTGILSLALLVPTMAILAPSLALGALLCAIMLGLASRTRSQALRPLVHADMEAQAHFEAEELWACRALPEAIAGGFATKISKQRWKESLAFLRIRLAHAVQWQKYQSLMEVAAHGVSILLCALAFLQWRTGDLPIGQFLSFLALALLAYRPVREAGRALPAVTRAAQTLLPRSISPQPRHGDRLSLDHLEFGFGPSLFHHLSFSLSLGEVALLHGPNGCGKSTLLRLCAGQLRPRSGAIVLPAGRIHWVDQETVLPPLSLRRWTGLIKPPTTAACQAFHSRHIAPFLPDLEWNT